MEYPKRKPLRLAEFNYASDNYYFVTICTHQKKKLFGMGTQLTPLGKLAEQALLRIQSHFPSVKLDAYVIMPNHIHAILVLGCSADPSAGSLPSLSSVVGLYKSGVSRDIHKFSPNLTVWQTSFYDRIIRNREEYRNIWTYIDENPLKWELDSLYLP